MRQDDMLVCDCGKHTGQFSATPVSRAATSGGHTGASLAAVMVALCQLSGRGGRRVCIIRATACRGSRVLIQDSSWKRLALQGTTEPWQECCTALRPDELVPALGSLPAFAAGMP